MLKNVTCDEIWKTTKFNLPNKIKYFNCNQRRIKKFTYILLLTNS